MEKYQSRKDVPEKYKWDLTSIFATDDEFNKSQKEVAKNISILSKYNGKIKKPKKLYEFLELDTKTSAILENLYVYAYLINDQELGNTKAIERKGKIENLYNEYSQKVSYFSPELLSLSKEEYENLFKYDDLKEYKALLDDIYRNKEHILSEKEEQIISELTNAMDNFDDISSNMLSSEHNYGKIKYNDGTKDTIATNNYRHLLKNSDRNIRKTVYNKFNKVLNQYGQTNASLLNGYVKECSSIAKIRNFEDSWHQKLFGLKLDNKVFQSLVDATFENAASIQKYYQLKKEIMGLDKLCYYDLTVPIVNEKKEYSIEEAQKIIKEALKPLGKKYLEKFNKIFDKKYIDYCQYKGKCSGAYSFATTTNDSRILMSYNGELDSVSTIAHEGGHNVHHQFILENNHVQYRGQASIVCEVASLTNECLLSAYLAKNGTTKEEKLSGLDNIINVIISNLFGAVREGYMEQEMYKYINKGGTLTQEYMDKLTKKSFKKLFNNTLSLDKNIKNTWINRSHYYMNFYLYSYAISISVATNVASKILNGDKEMLENYYKFLSTGCDTYPMETFEILGIDLTDKKVYEEAIEYFDKLVKQYEKIYNEKVGE